MGPVRKEWDYIYVGGSDNAGRMRKNWELAKRCALRLADELDLRGLLVGMAGESDVPDHPLVEACPQLKWSEFLPVLAGSRVAFFPNTWEPSPRVIGEALCLDVPILVNRAILGGWKYVCPATGRFFTDEFDVVEAMESIRSGSLNPREWFCANYGRANAGPRLAAFLRLLAPDDPRAAELESASFYSPRDLSGALPKPPRSSVPQRVGASIKSGGAELSDPSGLSESATAPDLPVIPLVSVLLASTPAAGGEYLAGLLGQPAPRELFDPARVDGYGREWGLAPELPDFVEEYLNEAVSVGTSANGRFITELHWRHLLWVLSAIRSVASTNPGDSDPEVIQSWLPNPRFVLLSRRDHRAHAIDRYRQITGEVAGEPKPDRIAELERLLGDEEQSWCEWFQRHDLTPLRLYYEDLLARPRENLQRAIELLDAARPTVEERGIVGGG